MKKVRTPYLLIKNPGPCLFFCMVILCSTNLMLYAQTNLPTQESKGDKVFQAGAYMSNITPSLDESIVGNWDSPPATYIHDQLHAKTLVLDDGETRLAFVIVDNVGIRREVFDEAKRMIHEETGLAKEHLLMAATHTHSGTSAEGKGQKRRGWQGKNPLDDYQAFVARRIADGVRVAIENLEPAKIAWGSGEVPQHVFNRRWVMKNPVMNPLGTMDKVKMNPGIENPELVEPAGPTDPEVAFIALQSKEGRPIALLGNYSLHYVGGVPEGHISADYFAIFGDRMQELLGADRQQPSFVGIMSNGTSGDINNINFRGPAEKMEPYEKMNIVANDVANEVSRIYKTLAFKDWVLLGAAQSNLILKVRKPSPQVSENMEKVRAQTASEPPVFHPLEQTYAQRIEQLEREWPDEIEIILQTFRIGDLGIAAIPFETFAETGLEIKKRSPFKQSFTIELANGSYGYLPTPEQHQLGGYETWLGTNRVEVDASTKIVSELMSLFNTLDTIAKDEQAK